MKEVLSIVALMVFFVVVSEKCERAKKDGVIGKPVAAERVPTPASAAKDTTVHGGVHKEAVEATADNEPDFVDWLVGPAAEAVQETVRGDISRFSTAACEAYKAGAEKAGVERTDHIRSGVRQNENGEIVVYDLTAPLVSAAGSALNGCEKALKKSPRGFPDSP